MLPPPLALLATCLTCLPCRSPAQQAAVPGGLALNLTSVVDWGTEQPFTDLFTGARTWVSQAEGRPWGGGPPLALDDRGCVRSLRPGQWATTILLTAGSV